MPTELKLKNDTNEKTEKTKLNPTELSELFLKNYDKDIPN